MISETEFKFANCEIDSKFVIATVITTSTPGWWGRLWGKKTKAHTQNYRSHGGWTWFLMPEFSRVKRSDGDLERLLTWKYREWEEREQYIRTAEKLNDKLAN
jgi:hypothetical protein